VSCLRTLRAYIARVKWFPLSSSSLIIEEPGVWAAEFGAATAWPDVTKTVARLAARELCQTLDHAKEAGRAYLVMSGSDRRQRRTLADRWQLGRMPRPKSRRSWVAPNTPAVAAKGRNLSEFSHELTGRYRTTASRPGIRQDADLPVRILAH
jgi:hypothetical protein